MKSNCVFNTRMTPLGCLLNKLKHGGECFACEGVNGYLGHIAHVQERLSMLAGLLPVEKDSAAAEPAATAPEPGFFIPCDPEKIAVLEQRGVRREDLVAWLDLFLAGELCQRVVVEDPCAKSRTRD